MPELKYRPEIDGLRAVAVVAVMLFHARLGCTGGFVGVDVFLVISGYLITALILKDDFSFASFWERRARRILPMLMLVVAASVLAGWVLLVPRDFRHLAQCVVAQSLLASNFYFWREAGYFAPSADFKPLLHTWSLAVEEQFYLLFPILLLTLRRRKISPTRMIGLLAAVSLAWSAFATSQYPVTTFYLLPSRAWELLLGAWLAASPRTAPAMKWLDELLSWGGMAAILIAVVMFSDSTPFPGTAALLPCVGTAMILWSNASARTSLGKCLATGPVVFLGLISYSLYLWHWPVLVYWKYGRVDDFSATQRAMMLGACVVLAAISWAVIETPFRKRWIFPQRRAFFTFCGSVCGSLLIAAVVIIASHGMRFRLPPAALAYADGDADPVFIGDATLDSARSGNFFEIGARPNGRTIQFLIWGDSHAKAIVPPIQSLCAEFSIRAVAAAHSSTLPVLNYASMDPYAMKQDSIPFSNAVIEFVAANHVKKVLLAADWEGYTFTADPHDRFSDCLLQTIQSLQQSGAKVWILKQVPTQNFDVPRALARAVIFGEQPGELGISLSEHRREMQYEDSVFAQAARRGAVILDPADYLVDQNQRCRSELLGKPLYRDSQHLTVYGAMQLRPLLEGIFEDTADVR